MKIRTIGDLEDLVAKETAWRKRELTDILFNARQARDSKMQTSLRAGVALLYAHWEGWIKSVARLYIEYVNTQRPCYDELSPAFLGNALRTRLDDMAAAHSAEVHNNFATFVSDGGLRGRAHLNANLVRTEGNLGSKTLKDIIARLGTNYKHYELLETLIDKQLVHHRNTIAHGEFLEIDSDQYEDLHRKVVSMLTDFTNDVLVSARTDQHLRPSRRQVAPG